MDIFIILKLAFTSICWLVMGMLGGQLYVHYVEYQLRKTKYSYLRYAVTIFLIFFLVWVLATTDGFQQRHWTLDLLPIVCMITGIFLTVKILFKKKGIRFLNK